MNLIIKKSALLKGEVLVPASKSQSIRGLLFALLATGTSAIHNVLVSDDTANAIEAITALGASITQSGEAVLVNSAGNPFKPMSSIINTGNSGITTHFVMPLLGLRKNTDDPITLDCGEQMRTRPLDTLIHALRQLGLTITCLQEENKLPIKISGKLMGGKTEVSGISSQYISALLIALPCAEHNSEITVKNLQERPYVEMTLRWLDKQNIQYAHQLLNDCDTFTIKGQQSYSAFLTTISGDFSSASYLIAAGVLIPGTIELHGLDMSDNQGDKRLIPILQKMGADIHIDHDRLLIRGGKPLQGCTIDVNDIPDLLPTLAVIGTQATGKTSLINAGLTRIKETDRIHSMTKGLRKLGAKIEETADSMTIYQSPLQGTMVEGYDDHRTVMSLALAGLLAKGITTITDSKAINKTFPTFISLMQSLGANIELVSEKKNEKN